LSSWGLAAKSLRKRRLRTALTVSGIVVGVAMILVLLSVAAGASAQTNGLLRNVVGAEITVTNSTAPSFPGGAFGNSTFFRGGGPGGGGGGGGGGGSGFAEFFGSGNTLNQSLTSEIDAMSGVYAASPQLTATGYIDGASAFLYGIDPSTYSEATGGLNLVSGSNLSSSSSSSQVIVSDTFATNLDLSVGSNVTIGINSTGGGTYTVVGIFTSGTSFGPQTRSAYLSLESAQSVAGEQGKVTEIFVKADTPDLVSSVASAIESDIGGVSAITSAGVTGAASSLSGTLTTLFTVVGLVALVAGAFGVVNTMMMSVSERTKEIGTLRAIGAKKSDIMKMFVSEAFLIGVLGAIVGVIVGGSVSLALPYLTGSSAAGTVTRFGGSGIGGLVRGSLQTALTPTNLAASLGLGAIVGVLAGIYPAWRASRMDPVEALRHV